ncbi:MAG TPA: response regulator transcription factor [Chthoniobacterales bacterium]|nr:response regulator transcription factor [Chthoniobacterales bacterium]
MVKRETAEPSPRRGIIVVDDHPLFRKGVVQMLSQEQDLEVRAEAENSLSALEAMRRIPVDLAIVDIGLHGSTNGIELTKMIKAEHPEVPILVLSMHDESLYADRALRAGARGYLMKREALDSVIAAVRTVLAGDIYVSPVMQKRMIAEHVGAAGQPRSPVEKLTDRELEVLQLIGEGSEVREIAAKLHVSAKTVEAHRAHIKEKLDLKNAREVVRFATTWVNSQR